MTKKTGYRRKPSGKYEVNIQRRAFFEQIGYPRKAYTFTVDTEAEAKAAYIRINRMIDNGQTPPGLLAKAKTAQQITAAELYAIMQADSDYHQSPSNIGYMVTIMQEIGDVIIQGYTLADLKAYILMLKKKYNTPGTIKKKVNAFKTVFSYARTLEPPLIPENIFDRLPKDYSQYPGYKDKTNNDVIRDRERDRRLEKGEEKAITKAIKNYKLDIKMEPLTGFFHDPLLLMFNIAINTAMRLQEIYLMQWQDIDFNQSYLGVKGAIHIRSINTKKEYSRTIPISSELRPLLMEYKLRYKKMSPVFLFPFFEYYQSNRKLCTDSVSKLWGRILKDFENLTFHDFRHEGVSRIVEKTDLHDTEIMRITGHKDKRTFSRYDQSRLKDKKHGAFY